MATMKRKPNWLRIVVILAAAAAVVWLSLATGGSFIGLALGAERDVEMTWVAPTKNCDGTPLTDLTGYKLRWGTAQHDIASPTATSYTIPNLRPGTWWVSIAAYNSKGVESQFVSGWQTVPPEALKTVAATVYTVVKAQDRFVFLPVGSVPVGTQCDVTQPVGKYHVIQRGGVTWSGSTRPVVVVADCG